MADGLEVGRAGSEPIAQPDSFPSAIKTFDGWSVYVLYESPHSIQ